MNTLADHQANPADNSAATAPAAEAPRSYLLDEQAAHRLLTVATIGGLALGTFGTTTSLPTS